jgi:hypothetical protein
VQLSRSACARLSLGSAQRRPCFYADDLAIGTRRESTSNLLREREKMKGTRWFTCLVLAMCPSSRSRARSGSHSEDEMEEVWL